MYYNEEHKKLVKERGDGYTYIGSYHRNEETIDGKNKNKINIRVKCPYCGKEYDVDIYSFRDGVECTNCCHKYENSFAHYIQQELKEPLNKYWDWEKNDLNPYCISNGSSTKYIWIKCTKKDYHGSYKTTVCGFIRGGRCPYCTSKGGKVHPKDSFGQWLIDTYGKDAIKKYWSFKNTLNPFEISKNNNKKVWMLCQEHDYHNDERGYEISCGHFLEGNRCPLCSHKSGKVHPKDSFGQYLIDTYGEGAIKKYWSSKNTLDPFKISKNNARDIWILCQEKDYHNDYGGYRTKASHFVRGRRCPYCINRKIHPKDSFGALYPEKAKYWSLNNKKSPYEVASYTNKKYKFICEKCGKEFEKVLNSLNQKDIGVVCKDCNNSQLEDNTKNILNKYNITYKREFTFDGLIGIGGQSLRFDFYLPGYNLLIECQGIQHKEWQETWITKDGFERQLEHDRRKRAYAEKHNINLLEIWYYDIDNIENILIEKLYIENN